MSAPDTNLTTQPPQRPAVAKPPWWSALTTPRGQVGVALAVLALALFWSYATTLATLADRWAHDPQYSHGFLVPVFALVVLWHRRDRCPVRGLQPCWAGLGLLALAAAMRLTAAHLYFEPLDAFSLVPAVLGLVWVVFGPAAVRWAWPAVAFLGFMLPLPFSVEGLLAQPLRRVATAASTYTLQLLGYPALSEGNHIIIDDVRLGVADACSGLGMLVTFFALATAVALILQPRWLDRTMIVVSAIPIALVANVARITVTGMAHVAWGAAAGKFVHDHGGWLMMPLALALLWLELRYLGWLLPATGPPRPLALNFQPVPSLPYVRRPGSEPPAPAAASPHDTLSETR